VQADQGPCLDCFRTGQPVSAADLAGDGRWPRFTVAAGEAGFAAVHAIPMRLRAEVIGALNFFHVQPGPLDPGKLRIGQALADVATIGLIQQRVIHDRDVLTGQLQTALNSRVLIEQAKGVLAERLGLDMADAFTLLRASARSRNRNLSDLAHALVDGTEQITTTTPVKAAPARPAPPPRRRQPGR
jgi:GAF domain-containing protein